MCVKMVTVQRSQTAMLKIFKENREFNAINRNFKDKQKNDRGKQGRQM